MSWQMTDETFSLISHLPFQWELTDMRPNLSLLLLVTGAREAADAAVVGVSTETSLDDHSAVLELVSARRRTCHHNAVHHPRLSSVYPNRLLQNSTREVVIGAE